jgi:hypothetical protein
VRASVGKPKALRSATPVYLRGLFTVGIESICTCNDVSDPIEEVTLRACCIFGGKNCLVSSQGLKAGKPKAATVLHFLYWPT